jgi:predicted MFS family arabinose efflux permease
MIMSLFQKYINNFKGFSHEVWILAIITFINRSGTMVLPFLSKYLKEDLHFSYSQVGWIMVFFGIGSFVGSFLGGKLSDKIGFYKIMVFSLFTSGIMFLVIQFVTSFWGLCAAMFAIMSVADMFRPAMFVSIGTFATPETRARAFTLVRLAVNLGFAAGPAIGGLIIMNVGYNGLFWVDGLTCIIAIIIFAMLVKEPKSLIIKTNDLENLVAQKSMKSDTDFWIFLYVCFATAMIFFQIFSTLPLYHHEQYGMTEFQTGLLMTMNGFLIFIFEMPIVSYFERHKTDKLKLIFWGCVAMTLAFWVLLIDAWAGILVISMLFITAGEILIFPFSNAFALSRAPNGQEGKYMGFFTMSFSLAHIGSSKFGMDTIEYFGYTFNWIFVGILGISSTIACWYLMQRITKNL